MNITHAEKETVTGDRLVAIFNRQKELMEKYHDIEKRSGLLQTEDCPVNINDKRGQARIKDFAWRITEEVGEALDAWCEGDDEHYYEELIDGLHFLTEMTILAGMDVESLVGAKSDNLKWLYENRVEERVETMIFFLVRDLGMMCNCLKNKPWKQTNMLTDVNAFESKLRKVWLDYIGLVGIDLSPDEIVDVYLRKSQVNKFRQRSNY